MSTDTTRESDELRSRRSTAQIEQSQQSEVSSAERAPYSPSLLGDARLSGRGNSSVRASVMQSMQRTHGNRAVQRFTEPTPWLGHGGRHSDWNGMPSYPNIGVEPSPGSGWMQSPHPAGGGGGGGYDPAFPGGGPFFNPTPDIPLPFHPMPGGGSGFGWQPSGLDEKPGPWAYYKGNGKSGLDMGVEGGFGAFHGEATMGGIPVTDDILYGMGKLGAWDNGQGGMRHGASGTVGVGKMSFNNGGQVSGDLEVGTATAEASWGDDGATLGAQATAVGGSMSFGKPTKASDHDEQVRLGLSEGIGMAGRLHWGDADKDGHREYGLGADFGPFSFDIKSEDPLATLYNTATGGYGKEELFGKGNMTDNAVAAGEQAWDAAKEYAGDIGSSAVNAYDTVAEGVGGAYDSASNAASSAWDWLAN